MYCLALLLFFLFCFQETTERLNSMKKTQLHLGKILPDKGQNKRKDREAGKCFHTEWPLLGVEGRGELGLFRDFNLSIARWVLTLLFPFTFTLFSPSNTREPLPVWGSSHCPFPWLCLVTPTIVLFCQICFIFCMTSSGWAFQAVISKLDLTL